MSLVVSAKALEKTIPIATIDTENSDGKKSLSYVYVDYDADSSSEIKEYHAKKDEQINWHPYVLDNQRIAIYISGVSGSGKSSFAAHAIKELRKLPRFKKHPVYFISLKDANDPDAADPAFKGIRDFNALDVYREEFMELEFSQFRDCICVFDDYNQLKQSDPLYIKIMGLLKKLLELGRKQNVMLIIINHQTMDYNKTRDIIFESDTAVLFPRSNLNATKKFIKAYVSDNKDLLEEISKIKGNQFTPLIVHKTAPQYLITPKWIKLF